MPSIFIKALSIVWTYVLPITILVLGLSLHFRTRGLLLRHLLYGVKVLLRPDAVKNNLLISPFSAFCVALSSTVGIGNIAGVLTAVQLGGPGALFWMWTLAIISIPLKFSETLLAVKYRRIENETVFAGPMMYLERLKGGKTIAKFFAGCALLSIVFGIGTVPQVHMVLQVFTETFETPVVMTSIILTIIISYITFGGLESISRISKIIMPAIIVVFVLGSIGILFMSYERIPSALVLIFKSAFGMQGLLGAGTGYAVKLAIENGAKRGVFSNESGLGSAAFASGYTRGTLPVEQGFIHILELLIDTLVINTLTGLAFVVSGVYTLAGSSISLIQLAYNDTLGIGRIVVILGLIFFAFTTIIAWSFYGSQCANYLVGKRGIMVFRVVFILVILFSGYLTMDVIWQIADFTLALMMLPNLYGLYRYRKEVSQEVCQFFKH